MEDNQEAPFNGQSATVKTILIVEDDASIGDVLVLTITQETIHHPVLVTDGFQALEIVKEVKPDLLLLDYHLPKMNGLELFDQLHAMKGLEMVPAILTSAGVLQYDIQHRKNIVGISKPVDLSKLVDLIEELID